MGTEIAITGYTAAATCGVVRHGQIDRGMR